MSRDAFSYDPQDAGETRDTSTRRSVRQQRSTSPDTRDRGNRAPEAPGRGDGTEVREQRMGTGFVLPVGQPGLLHLVRKTA
jgi:hypothetical protein